MDHRFANCCETTERNGSDKGGCHKARCGDRRMRDNNNAKVAGNRGLKKILLLLEVSQIFFNFSF